MYPPSVNEARELAEDIVNYIERVDSYDFEYDMADEFIDTYTQWALEGDCDNLAECVNFYIDVEVSTEGDKKRFSEGDGRTVNPSLHWMVRDEHAEGKDLLRRI